MNERNHCEIAIAHTKGARTNLLAKPIPATTNAEIESVSGTFCRSCNMGRQGNWARKRMSPDMQAWS